MSTKILSNTGYIDWHEFTGDTLVMEITPKDVDGAIIPYSLYTAELQVRAKLKDAAPLLTIPTEDITLSDTSWTIALELTSTQTILLGAGNFIYDLELTDSTGEVNTIISGKIVLTESVTRKEAVEAEDD